MSRPSHRDELIVLSLIGGGLILICVLIIVGIFGWFESKLSQPLPNWAENVLVALGTTAGLKLGDVLAALVTLATGRQVETLGKQLADSSPGQRQPTPKSAAEAAERVAGAAEDERDEITREDLPEPTFGKDT